MAERKTSVGSAGAAAFVSMADGGASARIAGAAAFVSMADGGASARIAGAAAFVSMADKGAGARIAGAAAFVSMADKGATCLRMQNRSIKSAKIPKSLHSILRVESFAQGSSRGKFLFYLKIQMWP